MPTNVQMERCISRERDALVFSVPDAAQRKAGRWVQIVDVFSLQVATVYVRDPQGRLLLEAQPLDLVCVAAALEQLVEQLPAAQATALRLTLLEGLSLRLAAERLEISAMSVQRAQKKAIAALRQQLAGGG
jgi:DNA-directed RNA polymerase specialized sigma24 family protein